MTRGAVTLLLIALAPLVAACQEKEAPPIVRPVLSVVAQEQTTETIGPFAGDIEPRYTVPLGFQVFGRLVARDVNVGDVVKKGARLAALDPALQMVSVRSAQASLASAEAQLATALAAEERQRTLLDQRVVAPAQFEVIQRNRQTAEANVTQAKDRLAKADAELGYTQLYATVDGLIRPAAPRLAKLWPPDRRSSPSLAPRCGRPSSMCRMQSQVRCRRPRPSP